MVDGNRCSRHRELVIEIIVIWRSDIHNFDKLAGSSVG